MRSRRAVCNNPNRSQIFSFNAQSFVLSHYYPNLTIWAFRSETDEGTEDQADQDKDKDEDTKKEGPKTRYDDINPQLLKCHICNKSMWDGRSFENHLSGRAHAIMMQKTAESYALTADTMRQEFKVGFFVQYHHVYMAYAYVFYICN